MTQDRRLDHWARQHALILLLGTALAFLEHSGLLLAVMAGASFLALIRIGREPDQTLRSPGWANAITLIRVFATLDLLVWPPENPETQILIILTLMTLDGLDGWLARKTRTVSRLGAIMDVEADSLLTLTICFLLALKPTPGPFILAAALLRPLYVLGLSAASARDPADSAFWTRCIGLVAPLILSGLLLPQLPETLTIPVSIAMTILLAGSFLRSWRRRQPLADPINLAVSAKPEDPIDER